MTYPADRIYIEQDQSQATKDNNSNNLSNGVNPRGFEYSGHPLENQPCPQGGFHQIRFHYKGWQLCLATILPIMCVRSKNIVCKKCNQKFGTT